MTAMMKRRGFLGVLALPLVLPPRVLMIPASVSFVKVSPDSNTFAFLMVDADNGITGLEGLTPLVRLSKDGKSLTPVKEEAVDEGDGTYSVRLTKEEMDASSLRFYVTHQEALTTMIHHINLPPML